MTLSTPATPGTSQVLWHRDLPHLGMRRCGQWNTLAHEDSPVCGWHEDGTDAAPEVAGSATLQYQPSTFFVCSSFEIHCIRWPLNANVVRISFHVWD
jgi:hypothetical protein